MFEKVNHRYILGAVCLIITYWLLFPGVANAAGPFTTSGGDAIAALYFIILAIGIVSFLIFALLLYFSFVTKSVKAKKVARVLLGLYCIPLGLTIFSTYFTPYYPELQINLPEGKNFEEVTFFKHRVITRNNGEIVIVPYDYYYPAGSRFSFSDTYHTTENGEKIYDVDIAYARTMYDFYREQPDKFPQKKKVTDLFLKKRINGVRLECTEFNGHMK